MRSILSKIEIKKKSPKGQKEPKMGSGKHGKVVSTTSRVETAKIGTSSPNGELNVVRRSADQTTGHVQPVRSSTPPVRPTEFEGHYGQPDTPYRRTVSSSEPTCRACGDELVLGRCPTCTSKPIVRRQVSLPTRMPVPETTPYNRELQRMWLMVGTVSALVVVMLLAAVFATHDEIGVVEKVTWQSNINLQENIQRQNEGWDLPAGSELVSKTSKHHHFVDVLTGYQNVCRPQREVVGYDNVCDNRRVCEPGTEYVRTDHVCYEDGYCEDIDRYKPIEVCTYKPVCEDVARFGMVNRCHDEPQYRQDSIQQDWYVYTTWSWENVNPAKLSGNDNSPQWPSIVLNDKRRETGRSQTYQVQFRLEDKTMVNYEPRSAEEFGKYLPGTSWVVVRNGLTIVEIKPIVKGELNGQ